ncbi:MAG: hypothetical protein R3F19_12400 [Verrucomicrobiales bacterium]
MNRIDTPQAAYQLSRALREVTGSEVTALTLGRVRAIEGEEGGLQRQMSARVNGEQKKFVAIEIGGKVSIYDASLAVEPDKVHAFLKRAEEARDRTHAKTTGKDSLGKSTAAQAAVPPAAKAQVANGWPARPETHTNQSTNVRANARRR